MGQGAFAEQSPRPSSALPLQSLSSPSQTSAEDAVFWLQTIAPPVHAVVPAAQTPCSPVLQLEPPPGLPLSITPLQSSSRPLHTSAAPGWIEALASLQSVVSAT